MTSRNIFFGTTSQGKISYDTVSGNFTLGNSDTDLIHMNANTNLGVGFTTIQTPAYRLDVSGGDINTSGSYRIDGIEVLADGTLGTGITSIGPLDSLVIDNDFTVDTNTFYVDSSSNQVGIGTTAPTEALEVNGNALIQGDLIVNGTVTAINTETLTVEDPLIKLAKSNGADTLDTGFYALYNDGVSKYAGLYRDSTDDIFKFFTGTTVEPTTTVDSNAENGYSKADILVKDIDSVNVVISTDLTVDTNTLVVNASSNTVGINKAVPIEALDVVGNIGISGNIIPTIDAEFDLGTSALRFKDLYLSNSTIYIGEVLLGSTSNQLTVTGSMLVENDLTVSGAFNTTGTVDLGNNLTLTGTLGVTGTGTFENDLVVSGDTTMTGILVVDSNTLYVDVSANSVGIGTTTPSVPLDVVGDINTSTDYNVGGVQVLSSTTLGGTVVGSSLTSVGTLGTLTVTGDVVVDSNTLFVDASTNSVGIGTTISSYLLDVSGDINFEGQLRQNGTPIAFSSQWVAEAADIYNLNIGTGNVGIGTTNPSTDLEIVSTTTNPFRIETSNSTQNGMVFANSTNSDDWQMILDSVSTGTTGTFRITHQNPSANFWDGLFLNRTNTTTGDLTLGAAADTCDLHVRNGIVGIGTISPLSFLDIVADTDNQNSELSAHGFRIQTGTSGQSLMIGYDGTDDVSYINSTNTDVVTDLALQTRGGNVGIGITNPSLALDVDGEIGGVSGSLTCQTVGALGYILQDEQSTTALSTANFTGFTVDFDNQSTDSFAVYKMHLYGRFTGNGGTPLYQAQFIDTVANISGANNYQTTVVAWGGGSINNVRTTAMYVMNVGSGTSLTFTFSADYTIHLGALTYENRMIGQHEMDIDGGTSTITRNVSGKLSNLATVNTRIIGMGFQAAGVNTGNDVELRVRVYRLL